MLATPKYIERIVMSAINHKERIRQARQERSIAEAFRRIDEIRSKCENNIFIQETYRLPFEELEGVDEIYSLLDRKLWLNGFAGCGDLASFSVLNGSGAIARRLNQPAPGQGYPLEVIEDEDEIPASLIKGNGVGLPAYFKDSSLAASLYIPIYSEGHPYEGRVELMRGVLEMAEI